MNTATTAFLDQIPSTAYRFNHEDTLTKSFSWAESIEVDSVPFRCRITAHENMWSGHGDSSDQKNRVGSHFFVSCEEEGDRDFPCESDLKNKRKHRILRRKGERYFRMSNLCGVGSTLEEPTTSLQKLVVGSCIQKHERS